ncbi:MAG TPA: potassium transporter TrkG [Rhodothermales bacterium]
MNRTPTTDAPRRVLDTLRARWRTLSASQLFVGSFLVLILLAWFGFLWLPGLYTGEELNALDSLFVATSAVCVTGLLVVDVGTYFTPAGQAYLLLLFQVGGIGIITYTTLIISALGGRLSLRSESLIHGRYEVAPEVDRRQLARNVVIFSLLVELVGFVLLYLLWIPRMGVTRAAWPALFHAISAFTNAGFSTYSDSLIGFAERPFSLAVIGALIVVGGLGFLVIEELGIVWRSRRKNVSHRLSLHSRLVLATTAVLLFGGWALFAMFEWRVTLADMPLLDRLANSLFMSVTARTAGFNTIDYAAAGDNTNFLTILLMTIGGSPGSTAGGLKTTTFALIGLVAISRVRGRRITQLWRRSIPEETIQRAIGLFVVVFGVVTAAIFFLVASEFEWVPKQESGRFLPIMFEAASAFSTTGISLGVTPDLSAFGRAQIAILMFLGRVGPLTFAAALARTRARGEGLFHYAYEDVSIG